MDLTINKIIDYSFIDGPGSRMAIFLQGCNMNCRYCHNPETQQLCNGCGVCIPHCPSGALTREYLTISFDERKCRQCDICLQVCPNFSSPKTRIVSVDDLLEKIRTAAPFIDGITVSGGECSLQAEGLCALLSRLKALGRLNGFVDTNGRILTRVMEKLLTVTDGFIFDLKAIDWQKHISLTGVDNKLILENMAVASKAEKLYEVRTVLINGYTALPEEVSAMAAYLAQLNDYSLWRLIPFRPMGVKGAASGWKPLSSEKLEEITAIAVENLGIERVKTVKSEHDFTW